MAEKRKQKELISVRVTTKFKEQLQNIADEKGMTLPDLVRYILTDYAEKNKANVDRLKDALANDFSKKDNFEQMLKDFKEKCRKAGVKID